MTDPNYIHITGLSHRYRNADAMAINNIELNIPRGSSFGLLGPNGAGKTTLLSILTGLIKPQSGAVSIDGQDIKYHLRKIKTISALVPQDYAFYLALSGLENLRFFADVYGLDKKQWQQRLSYCIEVCRLKDMLHQRVEEYSGGMKRRMNLAIGLLNNPQILYLDEPTVGIDAQSRQVIVTAIQELCEQGATVIYTSHYMEEVEAICDELAIINHGQVVAHGSTAQLKQQGSHNTLLLTFATAPSVVLLNSFHVWKIKRNHERQYELSLNNANEVYKVLKLCRLHETAVEQLQFGMSSLERTYLELLQSSESDT